ncbi:MAG: archaemetzincin [Planctomycetota bacterium]|jgi:archaemetzincin
MTLRYRCALTLALAWTGTSIAAGAAPSPGGGDFVLLGKPGPTDWRTVYPEPVQTLRDYERAAGRSAPFEERRLLLVPFGKMHEKPDEALAELAEFLGAYFMTRVEVKERREVPEHIPRRSSHGFGRQLRSDDVLRHLALKVPRDAVARVGITSDDLYACAPSGGSMNWVFGMGDARMRAAVCSSARFSWRYPGQPADATPRRRFYKLAAHEIGHVFGLAHCQKYACGMNGSNSLRESDATPLHLCPECLAKISGHLRFDRAQRYAALARVYGEFGWRRDAAWVARRGRLEAGSALVAGGARPSQEGRE